MNINVQLKKQPLTVGDLVVAVTDVAFEMSKDEKKAYEIARVVVGNLLKRLPTKSAPTLVH